MTRWLRRLLLFPGPGRADKDLKVPLREGRSQQLAPGQCWVSARNVLKRRPGSLKAKLWADSIILYLLSLSKYSDHVMSDH